MVEPGEALIDFATNLPDTIRVVILMRCLIPFDRLETRSDQDHLSDFASIIKARDPITRSYRVAAMVGAMTLAFQTEEGDAEFYQKLYEKHPEPIFQTMALRAPLRERHWRLAHEAFLTLLQGPLSPQSLRAWQAHLMEKDRARPLG
jgi:hypothetical protein